ncbi:ligase-associated DNA damage response exonuclease [Aestuariivirga sp.]|uniref:ligase-associated DNA damage response exonuclease n=1 Tax=Aestuariivirga sp. TaxID=2650926 RepID=UPI0039E51470
MGARPAIAGRSSSAHIPRMANGFETWLRPEAKGLYCAPGDFYIDPLAPVERAVITHGHSDHARPGHNKVLATAETLAIMRARLGEGAGRTQQPLALGERLTINDVTLWLAPAGHVLGSAQVVLEHKGRRAVISGDYKRRADATCTGFEVVPCDLFVTEATFALPVFVHESDAHEMAKLMASLAAFPERTHQIGAYGLGKCQRLISMMRSVGYDRTIWLHGAMKPLCDLYERHGVSLGDLRLVSEANHDLAGEVVIAPPSAIGDRWSRRFAEPLPAFASGWMRIRARARQRGVELPLIISDHADWPELVQTIRDVGAGEIWITHGRDDALTLQCQAMGLTAKALAMVGFSEEDGE